MFQSFSAKRARAIFIALVITFASNLAISYGASRSGNANTVAKPPILNHALAERSGNANTVAKPPIL